VFPVSDNLRRIFHDHEQQRFFQLNATNANPGSRLLQAPAHPASAAAVGSLVKLYAVIMRLLSAPSIGSDTIFNASLSAVNGKPTLISGAEE